jgi:hexokinase
VDKFMVHGKKERKRKRIIIIIIIIRNGAKTISLQTLFGRLNKKNLILGFCFSYPLSVEFISDSTRKIVHTFISMAGF